jgi:cyclopropane fatty-acyl-phospholipid synthase-like methyltransferase
MAANIDHSAGYDGVAAEFAELRRGDGIGLNTLRDWAGKLRQGARVLDLGCGSGDPIAKELSKLGFSVAGIDASPTLIAEFHRQLPEALWACEAVEESSLFGQKFDAILAVGLIFLLSEKAQRALFEKVGHALEVGGRFLFSAPRQACEWEDVLTGHRSLSLGAIQYETALHQANLVVKENYTDEGENYYFACQRIIAAGAA